MKFKAILFSFLMAGLIFNACAKEVDTTDYKKDEINIFKNDEKKKKTKVVLSDEQQIENIS